MVCHASRVTLVLTVLLFASAEMAAETNEYYLIHYQPGPKWAGESSFDADPLGADAHTSYVGNLFEREIAVMAGPTDNRPGSLLLIKTGSLATANSLAGNNPAVTSGLLKAEVLAWAVNQSAIRSIRKRLPPLDPNVPFEVKRFDPDSPINLKDQPNSP